MDWLGLAALVAAVLLPLAWADAFAQENEGGCVFDRRIYPEGAEMCQGDVRVRCDEGAWEDIGFCDDEPAGPPPSTGGGDIETR